MISLSHKIPHYFMPFAKIVYLILCFCKFAPVIVHLIVTICCLFLGVKMEENDSTCQHDDSCSRYSSKYPLPIVLASKKIWQLIQSKGSQNTGQPRLMSLNSDPNTRWIEGNRPVLVNLNPDHQSRYYRLFSSLQFTFIESLGVSLCFLLAWPLISVFFFSGVVFYLNLK